MALHDVLAALVRHHVDFIVVGGLAAVLHGTPVNTFDVDVVYARDEANLSRLLGALQDLRAVFRDDDRNITPNASHLRSLGHKLLRTPHGPLDLLGSVEQTTEYGDLLPDTTLMEVRGARIRVVTLERLIRIKEQLTRPKDRAMLLLLRATLDERDRKGSA